MSTRFSFLLLIMCFLSGCSEKLSYTNVRSQEKCECKKDAYWYNDKCWKDFQDESISIADIDSVVSEEIALAEKAKIQLGDETHAIDVFFPIPEGESFIILTEYTDSGGKKSMISEIPMKSMKKKNLSTDVVVLNGSAFGGEVDSIPHGQGTVNFDISEDEGEIAASGYFIEIDGVDSTSFSYVGAESLSGLGNSQLEVVGNEAFLSGDLGTETYAQIKSLIENHPNVKTLVLTSISGSVNDAVNMHTGRLVHDAKLNTKVLSDSDIASGAVDLFCAGENRIVEKGAKIGIHSWCCVNDLTAIELPRDHPAHKDQIQYFTMIMGAENGPNFYFHTLEAAPFDGVHWMSDEDIQKWNVSTQFINK